MWSFILFPQTLSPTVGRFSREKGPYERSSVQAGRHASSGWKEFLLGINQLNNANSGVILDYPAFMPVEQKRASQPIFSKPARN